jgi:hypothetical protein
MEQARNFKCPNCGSQCFVTDPNRYDVLKFVDGDFQIEKSEFINAEFRIFCRECGAEVNLTTSIQAKKLVLINS